MKFPPKIVALVAVAVVATGCERFNEMGSTKYGVIYRDLPRFLGGGVASAVIPPGSARPVMPWERVYRVDTGIKELTWGQGGVDSIYTRVSDGNEVALAFTIRYRVVPADAAVRTVVETIGPDESNIEHLVGAVTRSEVRRHINPLRTDSFLDDKQLMAAVDQVRDGVVERLKPYGLEVSTLTLNSHRFEHLLPDGTVDLSYEERLERARELANDIEAERSKIETIKQEKTREMNEASGLVHRVVEEAEGYKRQMVSTGDSYFQAKSNEAEGKLAAGRAEVEALERQIEAYSIPGSERLLALGLAEQLSKSAPKFVVMGEERKGEGDISVKRLDQNELLEQLGMVEALSGAVKARLAPQSAEPAPESGVPAAKASPRKSISEQGKGERE